jgi:glycosyltransferase involved in cell wall biosynthesis
MEYDPARPFWVRDGALLCQGLRSLGVDAKFVALGPPGADQELPLILSSLPQMEDAQWWAQWKLEGVILYAWAMARYEPIARAIKKAGLKLILVLDSDGILAPWDSPWKYLGRRYHEMRDKGALFPAGAAALRTAAASIRARHAGTVRHLEHGDLYALPSPVAEQCYGRFLRGLGRPDLTERLRFLPYAATADMVYSPSTVKKPVIISVGRWQHAQKNTPLLVRCLAQVLALRPGCSARIVGSGDTVVKQLIDSLRLPADCRSRIHVLGPVKHEDLFALYQESQISLCSSHYESFHIASGEALCCGCSVVGNGQIPAMPYFCSAASGTVSCDGSVNNFLDAVLAEIDAWRRHERDPAQISQTWTARLHPDGVAKSAMALMAEIP